MKDFFGFVLFSGKSCYSRFTYNDRAIAQKHGACRDMAMSCAATAASIIRSATI
ncbi:MAG: hypothetical protein AAGA75_18515 [Cyanobacteria bacterium P01_E01_bin.6]